ncbi:CRISPR-associated autoregulator, Cst2 family [Chitinophaga terrae (ex Kim and Jung 2007)]|uniref:CRISPR-associated autoregulator, Cst2 family n=1 Tax=Chitinophaga terrae (ex Kim and Jung 2007) TaxID=408074 RepID=A0A1H4F101_9BACT|nr:type I-B CRISPR-associated protein Cas7/Cst2/DevR [Chitinophaga terrae (ex Kim and Jung 2007)]MDQ0109939.1 CRISPR-associated protein Cst2 [Chitinophaga terrae (ex Kim and Jung 2007)]GEP90767.1 type I-B CRISPR-associated protein Cas7/Cst2/DevR [Chitinophaga terrae (ex Kim and Jung 2007)]SEA90538.1 CRISPR-associated autoregulator, Cst2 family [Chitinophaga terrae (ex Kim and Jung 2007)]
MNLKTQGFILIDVDAAALNNSGKSTSNDYENGVDTKKMFKDGRAYPYVSGQAWRYWWRETLQKNHGWELSPVTRDNKIAFTAADPVKYADDDVFGYMKAAKDAKLDEEGKPVLDKKGKAVLENVTVTRVSPLKNSVIIAAAPVKTSQNWSSMSRQEGDAVPYVKEEYSAIMKGMFSLDLEQLGTFSNYNKTGFKNLTDDIKESALASGATEIDDPYVKDSKGRPQKLVRLHRDVRLKRIQDTIKALKTISGGAMQTDNMADVTPKLIILATTNTGNHPFFHVASNHNNSFNFDTENIRQVLADYKENILGTVFIGRRSGFLDDQGSSLKDLESLDQNYPPVKVLSVNEAIDQYCIQLQSQIS